jgi:hypothetical protein
VTLLLRFTPTLAPFATAPPGQKREWPGYISRWRCSRDDDGARLDGVGGPSLRYCRVRPIGGPICRFFYEAYHLQVPPCDPRASGTYGAPPPWDDSLIAILPRPSRAPPMSQCHVTLTWAAANRTAPRCEEYPRAAGAAPKSKSEVVSPPRPSHIHQEGQTNAEHDTKAECAT